MLGGNGRSRLSLLCLALVWWSGCAYPFRVTNLDEHHKPWPPPAPLKLALQSTSSAEGQSFFDALQQVLWHAKNVDKLQVPHYGEAADPDVEFVVDVAVRPELKGDPLNYWITFPGFVLLTHAWYGFVYHAELRTQYSIYAPPRAVGTPLHERTVLPQYHIRFCDEDRAAATLTGWLLPGWGLTNALLGFYMVSWDPDGLVELYRRVGSQFGAYVAGFLLADIEALKAALHGGGPAPAPVSFHPHCLPQLS
mgnify:FL=1